MLTTQKLEKKLNAAFSKIEHLINSKTKIAIGLAVLALVGFTLNQTILKKNDISAGTVMVTNPQGTSGGTGVVLSSSSTQSKILTNSHVCGVVKNGGQVIGRQGSFMVTQYKRSEAYDLCLITVDTDLGYNTKLASNAPLSYYEKATVSGHPALLPTVMTSGHFSGRRAIQVMTGIRQCTEDDAKDMQGALLCLLLGGIPEIKSFDSVLVTATIMPGSSGSAVYNENQELAGLVFAGSGNLSYAWTVPYEAIINFLNSEQKNLQFTKPSNMIDLTGGSSEDKKNFSEQEAIKKLQRICSSQDAVKIKETCEIAERNAIWNKK